MIFKIDPIPKNFFGLFTQAPILSFLGIIGKFSKFLLDNSLSVLKFNVEESKSFTISETFL